MAGIYTIHMVAFAIGTSHRSIETHTVNTFMLQYDHFPHLGAYNGLKQDPYIHKNIMETYTNIDVSVYKITLCLARLYYIYISSVIIQ